MQTFLPLQSFYETAKVLDFKRLGKQRVEAFQIWRILRGYACPNKNGNIPWANHPTVKMWKGYENALANYYNTIVTEWIKRGYNNTMKILNISGDIINPPFVGVDCFHASHRSNLLRKDPKYYGRFGWSESPDLPYVWEVR